MLCGGDDGQKNDHLPHVIIDAPPSITPAPSHIQSCTQPQSRTHSAPQSAPTNWLCRPLAPSGADRRYSVVSVARAPVTGASYHGKNGALSMRIRFGGESFGPGVFQQSRPRGRICACVSR